MYHGEHHLQFSRLDFESFDSAFVTSGRQVLNSVYAGKDI